MYKVCQDSAHHKYKGLAELRRVKDLPVLALEPPFVLDRHQVACHHLLHDDDHDDNHDDDHDDVNDENDGDGTTFL